MCVCQREWDGGKLGLGRVLRDLIAADPISCSGRVASPAEGAAAEKARLTDALREFEANFERQHRRPPLTEDEYAPVQALREQLRELKRNRSFERPSRRNGEDRGSLGV